MVLLSLQWALWCFVKSAMVLLSLQWALWCFVKSAMEPLNGRNVQFRKRLSDKAFCSFATWTILFVLCGWWKIAFLLLDFFFHFYFEASLLWANSWLQGPSLKGRRGDMPPYFWIGGHNILCPPIFVMKIMWLCNFHGYITAGNPQHKARE